MPPPGWSARQCRFRWSRRRRRPVRRCARGLRSRASLPADEYVKAFRVPVCVFAVADTRRRQTYRKSACGHPWHNLPSTSAEAEQP
ncbi:DUF5958 family protein [Streptomyces sp. NPDC050448]|uniref:DUF5958 family protein n=1 Tax=Streptomyces sp. NPDC050448 TaxID=3155404 RepID=UPI00341ACB94